MNRFLAPMLAVSLGLSAAMAHAGGPVVIEDDLEVIAEKPASSVGILPVIIFAVALCAALCGSEEEDPNACATAAVKC